MRGYGHSSAPADAALYTPLHTAGDLVGLLDALNVPSAVLVGHDWGATHAWNAALMRPDRFKAVFCLSVPYVPRGDVSIFERMRKSGHQDDFYMFEQIRPEADQIDGAHLRHLRWLHLTVSGRCRSRKNKCKRNSHGVATLPPGDYHRPATGTPWSGLPVYRVGCPTFATSLIVAKVGAERHDIDSALYIIIKST